MKNAWKFQQKMHENSNEKCMEIPTKNVWICCSFTLISTEISAGKLLKTQSFFSLNLGIFQSFIHQLFTFFT